MPDNERDIMGRDAARLLGEQTIAAEALVAKIEDKLVREEAITPEEWDQIKADLDRTIMALSGLKEMGMLIDRQKGLLTKLESQREHLDRLEEARKGAMPEAA